MVIFRRRRIAHNVLNLFTLNYLLLPIVTSRVRTSDQAVGGSSPSRRALILLDLRAFTPDFLLHDFTQSCNDRAILLIHY